VGEELVGRDLFDEDYLWFYDEMLETRSDADVELIARLLGDLPDGAELLDAPCGHGRLAQRLAARGLTVTGLDITPLFLELARERAAAAGVEVVYIEGDMRNLPFEERFDAVVNWFTSFGYFDDEGNRRVLENFHRALRPGGVLLIEQASRDFLLANMPASGQVVWLADRGDDLMIDKVTFDAVVGRSHTERIVVRDGRVRRVHFTLAQFAPEQLAGMLRDAGFTGVDALDESGGTYQVGSRRLVMRARRS
jgi:SAM-dependent methyltransferase